MHDLQALLGNFPLERFVAEYYQRLPYSAAGAAASLCSLGSWESLLEILLRDDADVLVCRRNQPLAGARPRSRQDVERLTAEGYTLLTRHAERCNARLAHLAAQFERLFASSVNIHMYCTPGGQFGFGWHYDAEEVFIVQTTGRKLYSLRKNTVNPWPLEETLPENMQYEREIMPLVRCELAAGDWLYIPSGYWHMGESRETSLSLAIGVQPRAAVELFDMLRPQIVDSMLWRQRLPVAGTAAALDEVELRNHCAMLCQQLGSDLAKLLSDPRQVDAVLAMIGATPPARQSAAAAEPADRKA